MALDLTGIIAGALGGGASAVQGMAQADIEQQHKQDLFSHQQDAELAKAKAIEDYRIAAANQERVNRNARIGAAQSGIVSNIMSNRYGDSDADVAAAAGGASPEVSAAPGNEDVQAALTPEQAAVIARAKQTDRDNLNANPDVRLQALRGEMSPNEEASVNSSLTRANLQNDRARFGATTKADASRDVATIRGDAQMVTGAGHDSASVTRAQMRNDARTAMLNPDVSLDRRANQARLIVSHSDAVQTDPFATPEMKAQAKADGAEARSKLVDIEKQRGSRPAAASAHSSAAASPADTSASPAGGYPAAASAAADFMKRFATPGQ